MSSDLDDFVSKHDVIDIKIICDVYTAYEGNDDDDDIRQNKIKTHIRYLVMYKWLKN